MCILRMIGGKQRAVDILKPMIPDDVNVLHAPFYGGGAVEIAWAKENPNKKVVASEFFEPQYNFWHQIKKGKGADIADYVRRNWFPLPDRGTYYKLRNYLESQEAIKSRQNKDDPFYRACAYYVVNRNSWSGANLRAGMGDGKRFTESQLDKLAKYRLPENLEIHLRDSITMLYRIHNREDLTAKDSFIFADPPYYKAKALYGASNGKHHETFDHEALARAMRLLDKHGARWLITYDAVDEVRELYKGYSQKDVTWKYGASTDKDGRELIIRNYS